MGFHQSDDREERKNSRQPPPNKIIENGSPIGLTHNTEVKNKMSNQQNNSPLMQIITRG